MDTDKSFKLSSVTVAYSQLEQCPLVSAHKWQKITYHYCVARAQLWFRVGDEQGGNLQKLLNQWSSSTAWQDVPQAVSRRPDASAISEVFIPLLLLKMYKHSVVSPPLQPHDAAQKYCMMPLQKHLIKSFSPFCYDNKSRNGINQVWVSLRRGRLNSR